MRFEELEPRWMPCTPANVLAIIETVNAGAYSEQADVNQDGMVSPMDVLMAINEANRIAASTQRPLVMREVPGGKSSVWFSPCGNEYDVTLLARNTIDAGAVSLKIGQDVYQPTETGTFGEYQRWEFSIEGRGTEYLTVLGEFQDELLTVIIG